MGILDSIRSEIRRLITPTGQMPSGQPVGQPSPQTFSSLFQTSQDYTPEEIQDRRTRNVGLRDRDEEQRYSSSQMKASEEEVKRIIEQGRQFARDLELGRLTQEALSRESDRLKSLPFQDQTQRYKQLAVQQMQQAAQQMQQAAQQGYDYAREYSHDVERKIAGERAARPRGVLDRDAIQDAKTGAGAVLAGGKYLYDKAKGQGLFEKRDKEGVIIGPGDQEVERQIEGFAERFNEPRGISEREKQENLRKLKEGVAVGLEKTGEVLGRATTTILGAETGGKVDDFFTGLAGKEETRKELVTNIEELARVKEQQSIKGPGGYEA